MAPLRRNKFAHRFANIAFFVLVFTVVPILLVDVRYKYFDNKQYYKIISAEVVTETPKACSPVEILITRSAEQDLQAHAVSEMVLIRKNNPDKEVYRTVEELSINKGYYSFIAEYGIPCSATPGEYFWRGTVRYDIRGNEHITTWQSTTFVIR